MKYAIYSFNVLRNISKTWRLERLGCRVRNITWDMGGAEPLRHPGGQRIDKNICW
jgi:hypothetical protein